MKIYKNYINSKILQKIHHRGQKKHFVIVHLLIFTTLNFANHFTNSQNQEKVSNSLTSILFYLN